MYVSTLCAVVFRVMIAMVPVVAPALAFAAVFPDTIFINGFEPCTGVQCAQVACPGGGTTSISGTVYMPNGTLPLPNVRVYVPNETLAPVPAPPVHARCDEVSSGNPIAMTVSAANGTFTLSNVPAGVNFTAVIQAGKWRRQIPVPSFPACTNTALAATQTRLPRSLEDGDIPRIAIATGSADSLECVMRKTGVVDSEFGVGGSAASIQLYNSNGTSHFDSAHGGAAFGPATTGLWGSEAMLSAHDDVLLACEGSPLSTSKPATALQAMKDYADAGGRVYMGHWQNYWLQANAASWVNLATWNNGLPSPANPITATVDTSHPQGAVLSAWLTAANATATPGVIIVEQPKHTLISIDEDIARRRLYNDNVDGVASVQLFSSTLPVEATPSAQKGRLIFSDMHPALGDSSQPSSAFPSGGCTTPVTTIKPQDAALLYAIFDLERCVDSSRE